MNQKMILYLAGGFAAGYLIKQQMTQMRVQRLKNRLRQAQESGGSGLGDLSGLISSASKIANLF